MHLKEEPESSFRFSLNGILTCELLFKSKPPEIVAYLHINYCWMPRLHTRATSFLHSDSSGESLKLSIGTVVYWLRVRSLTATPGNA